MTSQGKNIESSRTLILPAPQLVSHALARDLEDCRKTSLNLLMAFLALHSITGSADLAVVTLTLMLYTISLHIAASAGASHLETVISGILHAVPAVGIFVLTSVQLAIAVKSPIVAISITIFCLLPTTVAIFQYLRMRCMKAIINQLPSLNSSDHPSEPSVARLKLSEIPAA